MSEVKCGTLILDAIDQLRKRKARPDLDRICHMLERRHGLKSAEVNEELSRLVRDGAVIKVDYKGNTSYRNAAKWVRTKTQYYGSFYNSTDISSVVLEAVSTLTPAFKDPNRPKGTTVQDIEQYLLKKDAQSNLNLSTIKTILEKEVAKKNVLRLSSGEYAPLKHAEKSSNESLKNSSEKMKLKADPEEKMSVDTKSVEIQCEYCLLTAAANRNDEPEPLLFCKECPAKAHPSCMAYSLPNEKFSYEGYWKCPECRNCSGCNGSNQGHVDEILSCETCHLDYHMTCHDPPVTSRPDGAWFCYDCEMKSGCAKNNSGALAEPSKEEFMRCLKEYPDTVPQASNWSIGNVESFFTHIGFVEESQAFREEEIDGLSLLLMKRDDVLTGLGIKLGPALKIYTHVLRLQTKGVDDDN